MAKGGPVVEPRLKLPSKPIADPYGTQPMKVLNARSMFLQVSIIVAAFVLIVAIYWFVTAWTFRIVLWIIVLILWSNVASQTVRSRSIDMLETVRIRAVKKPDIRDTTDLFLKSIKK